jgi:hypothetical protein
VGKSAPARPASPTQAPRVDPLLGALIAKLPASGSSWSADRRTAWLKMVWMALDVVYDAGSGEIDMPNFLEGAPPAGAARPAARQPAKPDPPKPLGPAGPRFLIDLEGFARLNTGERIMPDQVHDFLHDQRGDNGDLAAIVWADDSCGIPRGLQLNITS